MPYQDFRQFLDTTCSSARTSSTPWMPPSIPAGVDTEIATMIQKGVLPPGTTILPRDYMLPREPGGLYR
jgi:hypothetical protein